MKALFFIVAIALCVVWYLGKLDPPPSDIFVKYKSSKRAFIYGFPASQGQSFDVEIDCLGCCGQTQWCSDLGQTLLVPTSAIAIQSGWGGTGFYVPPSEFQQGRLRAFQTGSWRKSDWIDFSKNQ